MIINNHGHVIKLGAWSLQIFPRASRLLPYTQPPLPLNPGYAPDCLWLITQSVPELYRSEQRYLSVFQYLCKMPMTMSESSKHARARRCITLDTRGTQSQSIHCLHSMYSKVGSKHTQIHSNFQHPYFNVAIHMLISSLA